MVSRDNQRTQRRDFSIHRPAVEELSCPFLPHSFTVMRHEAQSTTNLTSAVWTTNSPGPVVVNELNTVTNPISGTQQFFRLSQ